MTLPVPTERSTQRAIYAAIRLNYRVVVHHSPNGAHLSGNGKQRAMQMGAMKGDGMMPGFPDLICVWPGGGKLLEVKREKGGKIEDSQKAAHSLLEAHGWPVAVVRSIDDALAALDAAGAPKIGGDA